MIQPAVGDEPTFAETQSNGAPISAIDLESNSYERSEIDGLLTGFLLYSDL